MSALPMADIHLSGHGILDLSSYETFLAGELHTCDYPAGVIAGMQHDIYKKSNPNERDKCLSQLIFL